MQHLNIVIFGLSITSSWGNGHATTFRSLVKALHARGHHITFFEKDLPWYARHRDLPAPRYCETLVYKHLKELHQQDAIINSADLVILGSFVPDSEALLNWLRPFARPCLAFYDIDTPVTLAALDKGSCEYLRPQMIGQFDLYLSFSGGPSLAQLEQRWGAQRARPLYCSVDPELYYPEDCRRRYTLGYLGTYSADRQPGLQALMLDTAAALPTARFCVAGAQYPDHLQWPDNVEHREHIAPQQHRRFYNSQQFTLNITRNDMIKAGYSPSVRLFEAGACAVPVISDNWEGLEQFFGIGEDILVASNSAEVRAYLEMDEKSRLDIGHNMRRKVMAAHTSDHRARELENYWREVVLPAPPPPLRENPAGRSRQQLQGL